MLNKTLPPTELQIPATVTTLVVVVILYLNLHKRHFCFPINARMQTNAGVIYVAAAKGATAIYVKTTCCTRNSYRYLNQIWHADASFCTASHADYYFG